MIFKLQILYYFLRLRWRKWFYKNRLQQLQKKQWKAFQSTLLQSDFYKDLAQSGAKLEDYPLMNKSTFMEHFNSINTQNIQLSNALNVAVKAEQSRDFSPTINDVTIGLSSGTSGNRGVFLVTKKERAHWVATVLDRVIGFSLKKRTVAFFLRANSNLYNSVQSKLLQFNFFDLYNPIEEHIQRLNHLQPTILVAQPSLLLELAKHIENKSLSIQPKKVISVAEVLYPEDQAILEQAFQQNIHQVYQCTEGFLASTCKEGTLHFNEDFLIIEKKYIDESKTRFHPVITDLVRHSQPVVRYELNDIIHEKEFCPCNLTTTAIEKIEGRSDDIFRFTVNEKTVTIFPDFIRRAIILSNSTITDYIVSQKNNTKIELYINHSNESFEHAKQALTSLFERYGLKHIEIVRVTEKKHKPENKLRRIVNEHK